MKIRLLPSSFSLRSDRNRRSISGGDNAEVGSSRMMMLAPENSTRESSTNCSMPKSNQPSVIFGSS